MTPAFALCAGVTAVSALVSLGFSSAALANSRSSDALGSYAFVRSLALTLTALAAFASRALHWAEAVASAMIIVQIGDGLIGLRLRSWGKALGPFVTAGSNLACLVVLLRR